MTTEGAPRRRVDADVLVIGSGPAGQHAAIEAARNGQRVVVVERQSAVGGVCLHTGTIPSKALREAVIGLTGYRAGCLTRKWRPATPADVSLDELRWHIDEVIRKELLTITAGFARHGIDLRHGAARFVGPHTVEVVDEGRREELSAATVVVAAGTRAHRPEFIPFDDEAVIDSDQLFVIPVLPARLVIVGGGVIAVEYASIFALLGIEVHLLARTPKLLPFLDRDVVRALVAHLERQGVTIHMDASARTFVRQDDRTIEVGLTDGSRLVVDLVMAATGRLGVAGDLGLEAAGLAATTRGLLEVNERFETAVPHVLAIGDVIGPPSLASTARVQGRRAIRHLLGLPVETDGAYSLPFGIYTVPEVAYVGATEERLEREGIPFVTGSAYYGEVARGAISGDEDGLVKLLFHRESRELMGAHIVGTHATELIHAAQAAIAFDANLEYFTDHVLNYPTLSECFKVAAFDAERRLNER